jgi:hypothetical protein
MPSTWAYVHQRVGQWVTASTAQARQSPPHTHQTLAKTSEDIAAPCRCCCCKCAGQSQDCCNPSRYNPSQPCGWSCTHHSMPHDNAVQERTRPGATQHTPCHQHCVTPTVPPQLKCSHRVAFVQAPFPKPRSPKPRSPSRHIHRSSCHYACAQTPSLPLSLLLLLLLWGAWHSPSTP